MRARPPISSGTLVWIPQAFVTFGILLLTIQFAARFLQAALGLPLEDLSMRAGARRRIKREEAQPIMLIVVVTMFVVLFAFLAGGLWIGWTLAVTGTILLALFRDIPLDKLVAQYAWNILTTQELLALPLFILMGEILFRTRLSQSLFNGPGAVGGAAARPAAARQRHRLLDLRGDLGIVGRDHAGGRPHLDHRIDKARLLQGRRGGIARRLGHAGVPDPAVEHHDHLRRAG